MKTSNKLLLGLLGITIIVIISFVLYMRHLVNNAYERQQEKVELKQE
jgi:hypothetical protein